jgi:PAS domain S-box-containing protein
MQLRRRDLTALGAIAVVALAAAASGVSDYLEWRRAHAAVDDAGLVIDSLTNLRAWLNRPTAAVLTRAITGAPEHVFDVAGDHQRAREEVEVLRRLTAGAPDLTDQVAVLARSVRERQAQELAILSALESGGRDAAADLVRQPDWTRARAFTFEFGGAIDRAARERLDGAKAAVERSSHRLTAALGALLLTLGGGLALAVRIAHRHRAAHEAADAARRESERRLTLLVTHAPAAIAIFDREMRYLAASDRWSADYGLAGQPIIGRSHYEIFPEIPERWKEIHRRCLAGAVERCEEDPFPRADGRVDWVRWEIHPWRTDDGQVGGLVLLSELITERRALQAQLLVSSKLAALGTLVAGVAHEINNPLAGGMAGQQFAAEAIHAACEALRSDAPLRREELLAQLGEAQEALGDAMAGSTRVARVVKDLVRFGRSDARRERLAPGDLVRDAIRWLPTSCAGRSATQVVDRGCPEVVAAPGQLLQVMVNLLTNACQASPQGRRSAVTVTLGRTDQGRASIEVADEGPGIAPELMDKIFDPFFTTHEVGSGMGLGLAVAHAIVADHRGTLTASSQVGKGSVFRVELPAAPALAAAPSAEPPDRRAG